MSAHIKDSIQFHEITAPTTAAVGKAKIFYDSTANRLRLTQEGIAPHDIITRADIFTSTVSGIVPPSGGGSSNFLRADGTWAVPAGTGGTIDGSGASNRITIWSDSDTLTSDTDIFWIPATNTLTVSGNLVINPGGADADTRIGSVGNANLFYIDASANRIGYGTSNPSVDIHYTKSSNDATARIRYENTNSGSSAQTLFEVLNDQGAGLQLNSFSSTYSSGLGYKKPASVLIHNNAVSSASSMEFVSSASGGTPSFGFWTDTGGTVTEHLRITTIGLELRESAVTTAPAANYGRLYSKNDGKIYYKASGGIEYNLTDTGGSGTIDGSGAANQLAFFSDSNTLTSNSGLFYDPDLGRLTLYGEAGISTGFGDTTGVHLNVIGWANFESPTYGYLSVNSFSEDGAAELNVAGVASVGNGGEYAYVTMRRYPEGGGFPEASWSFTASNDLDEVTPLEKLTVTGPEYFSPGGSQDYITMYPSGVLVGPGPIFSQVEIAPQITVHGNVSLDTNRLERFTLAVSGVNWSSTTLDERHFTIFADSTSTNITINLPSAGDCDGRVYVIKKVVNANSVTIEPNGSETIDSDSNLVLTGKGSHVVIQSDGGNWQIIASGGLIEVQTISSTLGDLPLDFDASLPAYKTVQLDEDIDTMTTANLKPGAAISVRIVGDITNRILNTPSDWRFLNNSRPTELVSGVAVLSLTSYGTTDADVIAVYADDNI